MSESRLIQQPGQAVSLVYNCKKTNQQMHDKSWRRWTLTTAAQIKGLGPAAKIVYLMLLILDSSSKQIGFSP